MRGHGRQTHCCDQHHCLVLNISLRDKEHMQAQNEAKN